MDHLARTPERRTSPTAMRAAAAGRADHRHRPVAIERRHHPPEVVVGDVQRAGDALLVPLVVVAHVEDLQSPRGSRSCASSGTSITANRSSRSPAARQASKPPASMPVAAGARRPLQQRAHGSARPASPSATSSSSAARGRPPRRSWCQNRCRRRDADRAGDMRRRRSRRASGRRPPARRPAIARGQPLGGASSYRTLERRLPLPARLASAMQPKLGGCGGSPRSAARRNDPRRPAAAAGCAGARSRSWRRSSRSCGRCRTAIRRCARGTPRRRRPARPAAACWRSRPRAPSRFSTARSGRATSFTNRLSPVSTAHGSCDRAPSTTTMAVCSGRWPGACSARSRTWPSAICRRPRGRWRVPGLGQPMHPALGAGGRHQPRAAGHVVGVVVRLDHVGDPEAVGGAPARGTPRSPTWGRPPPPPRRRCRRSRRRRSRDRGAAPVGTAPPNLVDQASIRQARAGWRRRRCSGTRGSRTPRYDSDAGVGGVQHVAVADVDADVAELVEEHEVADAEGRSSRPTAPCRTGRRRSAASRTPCWAHSHVTRPEQSKPVSGDAPPHLYGTPICAARRAPPGRGERRRDRAASASGRRCTHACACSASLVWPIAAAASATRTWLPAAASGADAWPACLIL